MSNVGGLAGQALNTQNQSIHNFVASLSTAAIVFGIQIVAFLILSGNWKLKRSKTSAENPTRRQSLFHKIYYYKTTFVSKRKRIAEPHGAIDSFKSVFTISDRELIRVAGVDAYLFLEYLQLLLRIFIPMAIVILPILLPINRKGDVKDVSGLDSFAWPNVGVPEKVHRLWAHLILALLVVAWVCYNAYLALRKFVRLRQTILTMPEHRIRASATTILVQTIPRKWLTVAALDALYDVFPGGIKDIWINRNYDELQEKVHKRTKIARTLESAETNLIIACTKKHKEAQAKKAKEDGIKKSRKDRKQDEAKHNDEIEHSANNLGTSSGNPHQIESTLREVLVTEDTAGSSSSSSRSSSPESRRNRFQIPIPIVGQGLEAVGDGMRDLGQGVGKFGTKMVGGFRGAFGGKHERDNGVPQLDRTDEKRLSSPMTAEFEQRGLSTDTHAPLHDPANDRYDVDGPTSDPDSPQTAVEGQSPTKQKHGALAAIKNSPINPLRHMDEFASPQPFRVEGEEFPLEADKKKEEKASYDFTGLYNENAPEDDDDALWRKYITPRDRETMRIPLFDNTWWPSLPFVGKKVDTIYYCRKELARLNHEIAQDQADPERFPLMNSAFIQFNHQVAAHMACQSLSHHIPRQMTPRTVEVNPNHVMWDNLSLSWHMRYLRMFGVIVLIIVLIIFWSLPVGFTAVLSQIESLTETVPFLAFLKDLPEVLKSFVQGVLPPLFLAILFIILPIILRFLASLTGPTTTGERELLVQNFYFAFVFIQLFLVVSLSSGLVAAIEELIANPTTIAQTLAQNLPKAANYFYSYMILQALNLSAGTLLQIGTILVLLFAHFLDTTPRQKVSRVLSRPGINWGNMIPVYTNFGAIGLVYSIVSPFIMLLMMLTFSLFWFTYRYQMIYVTYPKTETNGLIFPKAINQLFTGLYFLQICLIGLFLSQKGPQNVLACFPQAIIMIVSLFFTAIFQIIMNKAFGPLFQYLPITFEDEAVERDEEFQRAQATRWGKKDRGDDEHQSLNAQLEEKENNEWRDSQALEEKDEQRRASNAFMGTESYEMSKIESRPGGKLGADNANPGRRPRGASWADRSRSRSRSQSYNKKISSSNKKANKSDNPLNKLTSAVRSGLDEVLDDVQRPVRDIEAQVMPAANLFDDIDDTLEDIEPEARQKLIRRSFQHPATRALQPCVWIPYDDLGIAQDEIERTSRFSDKIWIASVNARLDARGKVMYKGLPPDRDPFENIEI